MRRLINILLICIIQATTIASAHHLTLKSEPENEARVSGGGDYQEGTKTKVTAYVDRSTGYLFKGWYEGDELISDVDNFYYTMPERDVTLTAIYDFDPIVPDNPAAQNYTLNVYYVIDVTPEPQLYSTQKLQAGDEARVSLNNYYADNCKFIGWYNEDGDLLSTWTSYQFNMPASDLNIICKLEYDPRTPNNPNINYWDPETGELIIDDFTPGRLYNTLLSIFNDYGDNNYYYNDVKYIIISGSVTSSDFSSLSKCKDCISIDFGRTKGEKSIKTNSFNFSKCEHIVLPASIESLQKRVFTDCPNLKSLTIHALRAPWVDGELGSVPDDLTIYVPYAALESYKNASVWKNYNICPIEDTHSITMTLPKEVSPTIFKGLWLELTNTKSGQQHHYVMTSKDKYTFYNIIKNTSWRMQIRNERGDIFGEINDIEVNDEDVNVTFDTLSKPCGLKLALLTPDGEDVSDQVKTEWTDDQGNYLSQKSSVNFLPAGTEVICNITLPESLATVYYEPEVTECTISENQSVIEYRLKPIPSITIKGIVTEANTGRPIKYATVSVNQTFVGKYKKTSNTRTDKNGLYSIQVLEAPSTVSAAATGYISNTVICDTLMLGSEPVLADIGLNIGAAITTYFTYKESVADGEEAREKNWISDHNNVIYKIYNRSQQQQIENFTEQYPLIYLYDDVEEGDRLELTAMSATSAFDPVESVAVIDNELHAKAEFAIVARGSLKAKYQKTENKAVTGTLFNADGKSIKQKRYTDGELLIDCLADGQYTLVTMGASDFFKGMSDLEQIQEVGLKAGIDFVENTFTVTKGKITEVENVEVPKFNESKFYYTGDNTAFSIDKKSVTIGDYIILSANVDFKTSYANQINNVSLIFDLPPAIQMIENSVRVKSASSRYEQDGNRIIIPLDKYIDKVLFCVKPTTCGEITQNALVKFDYNGETHTQPIGYVKYRVVDIELIVPKMTSSDSFYVRGVTIPNSEITIYDGGAIVGTSKALSDGSYTTNCNLMDPINYSIHDIQAIATTPTGAELKSMHYNMVYEKSVIDLERVTMYYQNPYVSRLFTSIFDYREPKSKPTIWSLYYPKKNFTYTVELSNNSPEVVDNVELHILTAENKWRSYPCNYDSTKDLWFTDIDLGYGYNLVYPVSVSVTYDPLITSPVSREALDNAVIDYDWQAQTLNAIEEGFDNLYSQIEAGTLSDDDFDDALSQLTYLAPISGSDFDNMSADELFASSDNAMVKSETVLNDKSIDIDALANIKKYDTYDMSAYGIDSRLEMKPTTGLNAADLIAQGFEKVTIDDGSEVYQMTTNDAFHLVDFTQDIYYVLHYKTSIQQNVIMRASETGALDAMIQQFDEQRARLDAICENLLVAIAQIPSFFEVKLNALEGEIETNRNLLSSLKNLPDSPLKDQHIARLRSQIAQLAKEHERLRTAYAPIQSAIAKVTSCVAAVLDMYAAGTNAIEFRNLHASVPDCRCDRSKTAQLKNEILGAGVRCVTKDIANIAGDIASLVAIFGGLGAAPETAGMSLLATVGGIVLQLGKSVMNEWSSSMFEVEKAEFRKRINQLASDPSCEDCEKPDEPDDDDPDDDPDDDDDDDDPRKDKDDDDDDEEEDEKERQRDQNRFPGAPDKPLIDPSGYVYEAVFSNRLEGVTATAYYKEEVKDIYGDIHENVVKWDAENYAQENPLFTDAEGFYNWDVPQGLWQVKFEKDGYETAYSDWLPVPPPQLDVNIGMTQLTNPVVANARAYEDAVEVEFDKYMIPEYQNTDNIRVLINNKPVEGTVTLLNEELSYEDSTDSYASKVRFNAATPFEGDAVTLQILSQVRSYADIRMADDYTQEFTIEPEIRSIICDSETTVDYGGSKSITVQVLPAKALKGRTITAATSNEMILSIDAPAAIIDEDGYATFEAYGELTGMAMISYNVEGTDLTASSIINVVMPKNDAATPKASITSGSKVRTGTIVALWCATPRSIIYYTMDGSCPCVDSEARKVYSKPIEITEDVVIKAIAVADGYYESEMAEFEYFIDDYSGETDIMNQSEALHIYSECGHLVVISPTSGLMQIANINGQYFTVSVNEGENRYPVQPGIYVIAGKTISVK